MKNQNPIEVIQGTLSKKEIEDLSTKIAAGVDAGIEEPLDLVIKIEFLTKTLQAAKKKILSSCIDEAAKYHPETASIRGVKIKTKEAGVKYDYSNTPVWNDTNDEIVQMILQQKELEARLKTVKGKETILHPETGELIELFQPIKKSTTTIEISFPK